MRKLILVLVIAAPGLAGCLPMMAASAVTEVAKSAQGRPVSNEGMGSTAMEQCTAQAARYGTVQIIDAVQHSVDQIIIWGTVGDGKQKRSFECHFGTKITSFKLREIRPAG